MRERKEEVGRRKAEGGHGVCVPFEVMRAWLLLLVAATLSANEFTYIVPVTGVVFASDSIYAGTIRALNSGVEVATVSVRDILQPPGAGPCSARQPRILLSGEVSEVGFVTGCVGVRALVLGSDRPIHVRAQVRSIGPFSTSEQRVDVATSWIEPTETAMIADVEIAKEVGRRANLILVNPNDFVIDVQVRVDRPETKRSRDETLRVSSRSMMIYPIAEIEHDVCPLLCVVDSLHHLTLTATGRFQAGASSAQWGGAMYRPAVVLNR